MELTNEFLGLNKIFDNGKPYLFLKNYTSLRDKVDRYAYHKSPLNSTDGTILSYLKAAILGKINNIHIQRSDDLVFNVDEAFNKSIETIKLFEKGQYFEASQQNFNEFKESFLKKIRETMNFLEERVIERLTLFYIDKYKQVESMINGTSNLDELAKSVVHKKFLSIAKLEGSILVYFIPMSALDKAGAALVINEASKGEILDELPIFWSAKLYLKMRKPKINEDISLFKDKIAFVLSELEKKPEPLKDVIKKLKDTQDNVQNVTDLPRVKDAVKALRSLDEKHSELTEYMEKTIESLQDDETVNLVKKAQSIINLPGVSLENFQTLKHDEGKLNKLLAVEQKTKNQIRILNKFQKKVYDLLEKQLNEIKHNLVPKNETTNAAQNLTDFGRWKTVSTIPDLRVEFAELVNEFKDDDEFLDYLVKLKEGMRFAIDLYERFEKYSDELALVNLLRNCSLSTNDSLPVEIKDPVLIKKINDLKLTAASQLIAKQYNLATHAFKWRTFPMSNHFSDAFKALNNTTTNMTEEAMREIDHLKSKLVNNSLKASNYPQGTPFYTWKYDSFKPVLTKLFNGIEVTLDADITRSSFAQYDAIKFGSIGLRFKLTNIKKQDDFDKILKNYKVHATHFGNSRYKVCDKFYSGISLAQHFEFTVANNVSISNDSNKNLSVLSPYATWSFSLKSLSTDDKTEQLADFKNEPMSLELIGHGDGTEANNPKICSNFDTFYKPLDFF